jgi:large subunit ribosomal protein L21
MYAVIETGGKQYRVSEGDAISVEKLPCQIGDEIEFDRVLLLSGKKGLSIGQPVVKGARVVAKVESEGRGRKILVWKYRPKQRYRRRQGHRQAYTRLRIEKIIQ